MAVVDPYSPCPCGSGEKFKWCCHKAETYVDRAMRLERNGQNEAALAALNEGLSKLPGTPWLVLRKAILQAVSGRAADAQAAVDELLAKHPEHRGGLSVKFRLLQALNDVRGSVDLLQTLLERSADHREPVPSDLATSLGAVLFRAGFIPAALEHLTLANPEQAVAADPDRPEMMRRELLMNFRTSPNVSRWLKNPYPLESCPEGVSESVRERFSEAFGWADQGLWRRSASAFELLSGDPVAGRAADVNLGLCRLWTADHAGSVEAIRRGIAGRPATTEVVDLECLCQLIDPAVGDDPVEEVELTWSLRDRPGLLERLRREPACIEHQDQEGDSDAEIEFALLDRPPLADDSKPAPADVPLVSGSILVGTDSVRLEAVDDGRLNGLIDRLAAIAGPTIPPAQPRTKILGRISRQALILDLACQPPNGMSSTERRSLVAAVGADRLRSRWFKTPMTYLGGATPEQAAQSGRSEVALRAALLLLEGHGGWEDQVDWKAFRSDLKVPAEPPIDPIDVVLGDVWITRLSAVDPHGLDDERLVQLRNLGHAWGLTDVIIASGREIASRRRLLEREGFPTVSVFTDLALDAAVRGDREAALGWVSRGRDSEAAARRGANAPSWDMLVVRVRTMFDAPEEWVPEIAAALARYEGNPQAMQQVISNLVELGMIELAPSPDDPSRLVADPTVLYSILSRYGPRVQAVGGAPAGGGIWTPGGPSTGGGGSGGGLWTPGSGSPAAPAAPGSPPADKPRIILPGR